MKPKIYKRAISRRPLLDGFSDCDAVLVDDKVFRVGGQEGLEGHALDGLGAVEAHLRVRA